MLRGLLTSGTAWLLAACGPVQTPPEPDAESQARRTRAIAPTDFVVAPCERKSETGICLVIAAGGKRVLMGAPAGTDMGRIEGDTVPPDAVILPSLHAATLEGLDEVRNRAWLAGRRPPLIIAGGEGISDIVMALNQVYATSDALAYIEGARKGGFNREPITAKTVSPGEIAFDTGDLQIRAFSAGSGKLAFLVTYQTTRLLLAVCGASAEDIQEWPLADAFIGCPQARYNAPQKGDWPLTGPIFLTEP